MKKHLITLTSSLLLSAALMAQPAAWQNCGSGVGGSSVTRTWDGGGANEDWFTADNWSGNVVPDCNDDVVFDGTTSKFCRITGNVTVRDITMNSTYKGSVFIEGTSALAAEDIVVNGSMLVGARTNGMLKANTLNVSNNGYAALFRAEIFGAFTSGAAGYVTFYSKGSLDAGTFTIGNHGFFRAPEDFSTNSNVKVVVRGPFWKDKVSTFDHSEGLVEFRTNGSTGIDLSPGTATQGRCVFYNLSMNNAGSNDNFQVSHTDTVIVANKLTINSGEFKGGGSGSAFLVIEDTLEYNAAGNGGSEIRVITRGPKTCDLFLSAEDVAAGASPIFFQNKAVIWKGSASAIASRFLFDLESGADVSFGNAVDVTQKRNMSVRTGASLALPAANTFNLENANLNVTGGTIVPGTGTFAFTGTSASNYDLNGGSAEFYNVVVNKGASGTSTPGELKPLTINGGGILRVNNDLTFLESNWRNGNASTIIEVAGDWIVSSDVTNNTAGATAGQIVRFIGNGNSNLQSDGKLAGDLDIQVNKDASSNTVTVTGTLQDIGNEASQITITKGKLAFDGTQNATLRCSDQPGLIVGADGQLVAPDDDELTFVGGSWNFAGQASLDAQNGTINMAGTAGANFTQNNSSVTFNNLKFSTTGRRRFGAVAASNSDELYVKGDFEIAHIGVRVDHVTVKLEGDFTAIGGTTTRSELEELIFVGSANQTISCDADELTTGGIEINKTGGKVTMNNNLDLNRLELTAGNLVTGSNRVQVTGHTITGGSSSSFVDGKLRRVTNSIVSSIAFPIGSGSAYRPMRISNTNQGQTWEAEYFAANPKTALGSTVNSPLDDVSTSEYWRLERVAGSANTTVSLSTNGNTFADADTRVARWNTGTSSWDNFGPGSGAGTGLVTSSSTISATGTYNFTLGVDNPAPNRVINGIEVSGNELTTEKSNLPAASAVAAPAVSFTVYPNPVSETLFIALNGADKGSVVLTDMSGKVLGVYNVAETRSINMRNLSAGVYFAIFTDGVNRITHRVVRD